MTAALHRLVTAVQLLLAALLGWMGLAIGIRAVRQVRSGWLDPLFAYEVALGVLPLALSVAVGLGTVRWIRTGRRTVLIAADLLVIGASWTILLVLVFLPENTMLPVLALGPIALVMLIAATRYRPPERSRRRGRERERPSSEAPTNPSDRPEGHE